MVDFSKLKRQSGNLDKLAKAMETVSTGDFNDRSENYWRPETDKAGNGMATFRFLPAPGVDGDDALPWVKVFSHGFQGPGGWFIDNCLTTKNEACPVCEHNSTLWNSGIESNKEIVRKQKRKLNYIANVYIVSDPKNPENEGKVKLFKFGKKIFDKITEAMNPAFEDEVAINPFDLWSGANFKLKIRKVEGYANYDKSEFESPSALSNDDAELEKIWKSEYSLLELVSEKEFKTYDQLKTRLNKVLGINGEPVKAKTTVEQIRESAPKPVEDDAPWVDNSTVEEDDDLAYFNKFAELDD